MARPANALIVDDEPHVRAFLRLLLRELNILQTWEATNGASALEMVAQHRPELVLLDVNLPFMTGLEALAKIKAANPELPVIMVSGENAMNTVLEAVRLGASGYVIKHSPRAEALQNLRDALEPIEGADAESGESETP